MVVPVYTLLIFGVCLQSALPIAMGLILNVEKYCNLLNLLQIGVLHIVPKLPILTYT